MAVSRLGATLTAAAAFQTAAQVHVYVDDDAAPGGDGLSWATAMNDLREAVQLAEDLGEQRGAVRIAGGDYLGDLAEPLRIDRYGGQLSGIVLQGGFAGLSDSASPDTRNLSAFVTTLRGLGDGPIVQVTSAAVLTGPRELGPGAFGALSGINLARAGVFDGLRFVGDQAISLTYCADVDEAFIIRDCEFRDGSDQFNGGAIEALCGSWLIERSSFRNNAASRGGAIRHDFGVMAIHDCLFENNSAGLGGAVSSFASALRIERSVFEGNISTEGNGGGGAVFHLSDGLLLLHNADFRANSAELGGAVFTASHELEITGGSFIQNSALLDGGAMYSSSTGDGSRRWIGTRFEENDAGRDGGALYIIGGTGLVAVNHSLLESNIAGGDGGAVCSVEGNGTTIISLFATQAVGNVAGGRGGAVLGEVVGAGQSEFALNEASQGGAICGRTVNVFGSSFLSNAAAAEGGAVFAANGGFVSSGGFTDNSAGLGGATFGPVEVRRSWFQGNAASEDGGAVHGAPFVEETSFHSNTAGLRGGAIFEAGVVERSTFTGNSAGLRGGAVFSMASGDRLEITGNTAGFGGGGLRLTDGFELLRSEVVGNLLTQPQAPLAAGEQIVIDGGVGTIDRCLIASEQASSAGALTARLNADLVMLESMVGGQLWLDRSNATVRGCTIAGTPGSLVPAVRATVGSLLFFESSAAHAERAVQLEGNAFGVFLQSFIAGGTAGVQGDPQRIDFLGEIISGDPGFADPLGPDGDWSTWHDNDYSLRGRSRLIDIGYGLGVGPGTPRRDDLAGEDRVEGDPGVPGRFVGPAPVDIGAYEFQGASCLPDMNDDGTLSPSDFSAWVIAYNAGDRFADQNQDGLLSPADFTAWVNNFAAGCD